jgi:hypothetical protein
LVRDILGFFLLMFMVVLGIYLAVFGYLYVDCHDNVVYFFVDSFGNFTQIFVYFFEILEIVFISIVFLSIIWCIL